MKKLIILGAFLFSINSLNAQTSTNYEEASNPISTNPSLWVKVSAPQVSWGSTDIRYKKEEPAPIARLKKTLISLHGKVKEFRHSLLYGLPKHSTTYLYSQ